jgi:hypothetical protein
MIRRGGKAGPKHGQYRRCTRWDVHGGGPSVGLTTAYLPRVLAAISPQKIRFPNPLNLMRGSQGQKSSSRMPRTPEAGIHKVL